MFDLYIQPNRKTEQTEDSLTPSLSLVAPRTPSLSQAH